MSEEIKEPEAYLLNCPFCDQPEYEDTSEGMLKSIFVKSHKKGRYYVWCACCGARCGITNSKDHAVNVWNIRTRREENETVR